MKEELNERRLHSGEVRYLSCAAGERSDEEPLAIIERKDGLTDFKEAERLVEGGHQLFFLPRPWTAQAWGEPNERNGSAGSGIGGDAVVSRRMLLLRKS